MTKRQLDNHRINSYQLYLATLSPSDRTLWTATKRLIRTDNIISPLITPDRTAITDLDKLEALVNYFTSCFMPNAQPEVFEIHSLSDNSEMHNQFNHHINSRIEYVSPIEVLKLIKKLLTGKSV